MHLSDLFFLFPVGMDAAEKVAWTGASATPLTDDPKTNFGLWVSAVHACIYVCTCMYVCIAWTGASD